MVPTARVVGAVVLAAVLTFYAAMSEVSWLFLLALWMLALVPAALSYAAWNRHGVTLALDVRGGMPAADSPIEDLPDVVLKRSPQLAPVFEGDGMGVEIALRARGGRRGPAWAAGEVAGHAFTAGAGVVTKEGWSRVQWVPDARRGAVRAGGWTIGTSDPLGFFRGLKKMPEAELAIVLPRFASLAHRHPSREIEAAVAAPRAGAGSELFGIREYRPGDSLRRIHWRSSARHGELVVREYEPPGAQTVAIFVDPRPPTIEVADQVARIAASEAWDCLREGGRVVFPGALDTRDVWVVLEWLARYPEGAAEFTGGPSQNTIVVTADPKLLRHDATRNWLVGDAPAYTDAAFERVGTTWPL